MVFLPSELVRGLAECLAAEISPISRIENLLMG
jgi:hypothetical protein